MSMPSSPERPIVFTEGNLKLADRNPGVLVETDLSFTGFDERQIRGNMEAVTADLIFATDSILLAKRSSEKQRITDAFNRLADAGIGDGPPKHRPGFSQDMLGLLDLSARLSQGLLHPQGHEYSLGGVGTRQGALNTLGQRAVSWSFDYDSPRGGGFEGAHWFKKALQVIWASQKEFALGAYATGIHPLLTAEQVATALSDPELSALLDREPVVHVTDAQPTTIPELKYASYSDYESQGPTGNTLRLGAALGRLRELAKPAFLQVQPLQIWEPRTYGARMETMITDVWSSFGVRLSFYGDSRDSHEEVHFTEGKQAGDFALS